MKLHPSSDYEYFVIYIRKRFVRNIKGKCFNTSILLVLCYLFSNKKKKLLRSLYLKIRKGFHLKVFRTLTIFPTFIPEKVTKFGIQNQFPSECGCEIHLKENNENRKVLLLYNYESVKPKTPLAKATFERRTHKVLLNRRISIDHDASKERYRGKFCRIMRYK